MTVDYRRRISSDRLASYLAVCDDDLTRAMRLYEWNCAVSGAFYEVLGHVEVVLRNALHEELTMWHQGEPGHWYDDPGNVFTEETRRNIAEARRRIGRGGRPETPGKVVSELNFGFWKYLLVKRYKDTLWRDALRHGFPNLVPADTDKLFARVNRLHGLRNRIAHHEQIHTRKLEADRMDCLVTVGSICFETRSWVEHTERVGGLLGDRPEPRDSN